jgi:hypothetical protein
LAARALLAEESGLHGKNNDLPHQIKWWFLNSSYNVYSTVSDIPW